MSSLFRRLLIWSVLVTGITAASGQRTVQAHEPWPGGSGAWQSGGWHPSAGMVPYVVHGPAAGPGAMPPVYVAAPPAVSFGVYGAQPYAPAPGWGAVDSRADEPVPKWARAPGSVPVIPFDPSIRTRLNQRAMATAEALAVQTATLRQRALERQAAAAAQPQSAGAAPAPGYVTVPGYLYDPAAPPAPPASSGDIAPPAPPAPEIPAAPATDTPQNESGPTPLLPQPSALPGSAPADGQALIPPGSDMFVVGVPQNGAPQTSAPQPADASALVPLPAPTTWGYSDRPGPPPGTLGRTYLKPTRMIEWDKHPRIGQLDVEILDSALTGLPQNATIKVTARDMYNNFKPLEGFRGADNIWHFESEPLLMTVPQLYDVRIEVIRETTIPERRYGRMFQRTVEEKLATLGVRRVRLIPGRIVDLVFY